jgi:hypothetical protein
MLRLELELEREGKELGELDPESLAYLAYRIDLPELMEIAIRMEEGLQSLGKSFEDSSAQELTEMLGGLSPASPFSPERSQSPT